MMANDAAMVKTRLASSCGGVKLQSEPEDDLWNPWCFHEAPLIFGMVCYPLYHPLPIKRDHHYTSITIIKPSLTIVNHYTPCVCLLFFPSKEGCGDCALVVALRAAETASKVAADRWVNDGWLMVMVDDG